MSVIHTLTSEVDLKKEVHKYIKMFRGFEQKALYTANAAQAYYDSYDSRRTDAEKHFSANDCLNFGLKHALKKNKKTAFISLGCGNAYIEKNLLSSMQEKEIDFSYFGIDSSLSMLELTRRNLEELTCPKHFVCADFTSDNFHNEFGEMVQSFEHRVFAFFGSTLANTSQSFTADAFRNLLKSGDYLWLDVDARKDTSNEQDGFLFEKALDYTHHPGTQKWLSLPLTQLGVPLSNGEMILEMTKEKSVGALKFTISFLFHKRTDLQIKNEIITILPDDTIELLNIRVYEIDSLIKFFAERNFELVHQEVIKGRGEIILKKI